LVDNELERAEQSRLRNAPQSGVGVLMRVRLATCQGDPDRPQCAAFLECFEKRNSDATGIDKERRVVKLRSIL
jgi:hypothetical protein